MDALRKAVYTGIRPLVRTRPVSLQGLRKRPFDIVSEKLGRCITTRAALAFVHFLVARPWGALGKGSPKSGYAYAHGCQFALKIASGELARSMQRSVCESLLPSAARSA